LIISHSLIIRRRNASDENCRENQKQISCSIIHFVFLENPAVYEINVEKPVRAEQATNDNMAYAHSIQDA